MAKYIAAVAVLCVMLGGCAMGQEQVGQVEEAVQPDTLLYAGTAKVEINPDQAVISVEGEAFRLPDMIPEGEKIPPDNIQDDLYARVVVLKNDKVSLAIVSADLFLFSSKHVVDEAKKQWGIDHVILNATNTHSGMVPRGLAPTDGGFGWCFEPEDPGVVLDWPGFSEDPWYAATEEKIIAAIGAAAQDLFPATVSAGQAPLESDYLAHNRRFVAEDGTVIMLWDNPNRIATKPLDQTVRVVRVDDETGKPRALLVNYACHPAMLMEANVISRGFPGAMVDYVEEKLGDSCMAMFLQGGGGDIDPYEIHVRGESGFKKVEQAGISLGEAALKAVEGVPASPESAETTMQVKESMLKIAHRTEGKFSDVCLTTVVINDNLALVAIPGMPFVQHQLNLAEKSPAPNTLMLGLAYSGQGSPYLLYIPTAQAVKEGGRGAEDCAFLSPDAGDIIVNEAVTSISELLAK